MMVKTIQLASQYLTELPREHDCCCCDFAIAAMSVERRDSVLLTRKIIKPSCLTEYTYL